jgi:hypothetical protein
LIRSPEIEDVDRLSELTFEVYGDFLKKHGVSVNSDNLRTTTEAFIRTKQCIVVERGGKIVGVAGWQMSPHPVNYSCKIFQEVLWCLKSDNVMDASMLLKAIERKAVELKADIVILANLHIEHELQLRKIYMKLGYSFLESHYAKTIRRQ